MFVEDEDLIALYELRKLFIKMTDEEFTTFFNHIQHDELGRPDYEYSQLGFEGRLSFELFNEALICERDRREGTALAATTPLNISVIVLPVEKVVEKNAISEIK